jgi:hypothetical protein
VQLYLAKQTETFCRLVVRFGTANAGASSMFDGRLVLAVVFCQHKEQHGGCNL